MAESYLTVVKKHNHQKNYASLIRFGDV